MPAAAVPAICHQKISLNTPVRVSKPTIKMIAIIHRIIFISFAPHRLNTFPVSSIDRKNCYAASLRGRLFISSATFAFIPVLRLGSQHRFLVARFFR
ncbi:hypothetical protein CKF43_04085 [Pantoea graminicola]|nr:hypothetical protein CKF43_04085 [Pantoea sp. ARC607]